MKMVSVSAFIIARDEERGIGFTIDSLKRQSYPIDQIVVVDDGSKDATPTIAKLKGCDVVRLPYHVESYVGRPELATVCNAGLKRIKEKGLPNFILQMGADHMLSKDYVKYLLRKMISQDVKIASGGTQFKELVKDTPWGSGLLIDAKIWDKINGVVYPVNWGYESWIIYKFRSLGYEVTRFDDVKSNMRPLRMYPEKAFNWGRCTYALGGSLPFALIKAGGMGSDGLSFMKGYLSRRGIEKHGDIAQFVKRQQYARAKKIMFKVRES